MVIYPWAFDKNGNPVNIEDVNEDNKNELKPFYCPYCYTINEADRKIFDVTLKTKTPYFSHKPEDLYIEHGFETKAHKDAKKELYSLLEESRKEQKAFYIGIILEKNQESHSNGKNKAIQRINILKDVVKVDFERYVDNENADTKIKPDISLFNNHGKVIRAIEINVTHAIPDRKKEALKTENIETIELKIEESETIKSKLDPIKEIKIEVNKDEVYNIKVCEERIGGSELCFRETQRERLPCFVNSIEIYEIFDFEKCPTYRGQKDDRCNKCSRKLLNTERDYCKDCDEKRIEQEREDRKRLEKINGLKTEAQELFEKELYAEAIEKWKKVLNLDPENKIAEEGIKKVDDIEKEIEIKKKNQIIKLNSEALGLFEKKLWAEAITKWHEVLKLDPQNKTAIGGINKAEEENSRLIKERINKERLEKAGFIPANKIIKAPDDYKIIKIKDLNLPPSVIDFYLNSGITDLYPPQASAIKAGLLEGKNLVAAIPTASGKTLLAEFAMLRSILDENKPGKAIYIVPLRALASEKYESFLKFESILKSNRKKITTGIATGDFDSRDDWLGKFDIIVATSEKVDSLLRIGSRWMDEITVVVADEVHLIDSPDRGPTLEIVLAKLMRQNPQIIALSATIGNAGEVAKWLNAALVLSDWRPTQLKEGVFSGKSIIFGDRSTREVKAINKESAISLSADTLIEGGQCLVFESSRKNTEGLAARIGDSITSLIQPEIKEQLKKIAVDIRESSEVETAKNLAMCVDHGSAFHHAGLITEQRKLIEDGFRKGLIKVIVATPTLAAGLNLPARRVIIKGFRRYDVNEGMVLIPVLEYKQMAGRAGRPRLDPYGESVLVAKNYDELPKLMEHYVYASPEKIWSKLGSENALRTHILSTIVTGYASNMGELIDFMSYTFYSTQQEPWSLKAVIQNIIKFLSEKKMIIEKDGLFPTQLGTLVSHLYIDPLSASTIIEGMAKIEKKGIKFTEMTLLHLVSMTPDMRKLYLRTNDYKLLSDIVMAHNAEFVQTTSQGKIDYEWFLSEVKTASVMLDWINEKKEEDIVKKYGIGEGDIRALSETMLWLVHSMAELGAYQKRSCTQKARELEKRVEYGASPELLDLIQIRGIGRVRARKLYNAGFRDMEALRAAKQDAIAKIIGPKIAIKILKQIGSPVSIEEPPEEQRKLGDFG